MEAKSTILVVDDEPEIVELMRDFLEADGFQVMTATNADEALTTLDRVPIDCLLLDVMLPGRSGFDAGRQIRETRDLPILFLSARDGDTDKIRGLALGGDDYVVKTATPGEVVARVKAVLRRYRRGEPKAGPPATLDFGRLVLDVRAQEVQVAGQVVPFTAKEFELLRLLAEHPRQVFTRDQLFERLWGDVGDRHTVTVHVARIREKIEPDSAHPSYVVTVWGVGYRFEGVRR
ncbi:MAG: response regulator transcription factor [Chloroflexota bacterium]